jgi:hypothetical protein
MVVCVRGHYLPLRFDRTLRHALRPCPAGHVGVRYRMRAFANTCYA